MKAVVRTHSGCWWWFVRFLPLTHPPTHSSRSLSLALPLSLSLCLCLSLTLTHSLTLPSFSFDRLLVLERASSERVFLRLWFLQWNGTVAGSNNQPTSQPPTKVFGASLARPRPTLLPGFLREIFALAACSTFATAARRLAAVTDGGRMRKID